jgi:hypothetical protein
MRRRENGPMASQVTVPLPGSLREDQVRRAAARFRAALERVQNPELVSLQTFPAGACGDSSEMLGDYLRGLGLGLGDPMYLAGETADGDETHAWLVLGGLRVDITADQFDGVDESVIVTRDDGLHRRWIPDRVPRPAGLAHWDGPCHAAAERDYQRVLACVDSMGTP